MCHLVTFLAALLIVAVAGALDWLMRDAREQPPIVHRRPDAPRIYEPLT